MLSRINPWSSDRRARRQQRRLGNTLPCPPITIKPGRSTVDRSPETLQESSHFFMMLPPELRRQILVGAFGNRTLHMDLRYRLPYAPLPPGAAHAMRTHAGVWYDDPYEGAIMDETASEDWRWFGCVCHARPGHALRYFDPPRPRGMPGPLNIDRCLQGEALCPGLYLGRGKTHDPALCVIGAMGWLLSCRQALVEGLEVLYGTNTLRILSIPIIYNLALFIPPTQLDQIISLDLDLLLERKPTVPIATHATLPFVNNLSIPPAADFIFPFLPSLRYLHLAIERHYDLDKLHSTYNAAAEMKAIPDIEERRRRRRKKIESQVLVHIDSWIRQIAPAGAECDVSFPASMYNAIIRDQSLAGPDSKLGVTCERALWRQIAAGTKNPQDERCSGYWIQGGLYDTFNYVCTLGTGFAPPDV